MKKICILLTFVKEIDNYSNVIHLFKKEDLILCISDFERSCYLIMKKFCYENKFEYIKLSKVLEKKIKFTVLITQNFQLRHWDKFSIKHFLKFIYNKVFLKKKVYIRPIVKKELKTISENLLKFPKGLDASNFLSKKNLYKNFDKIFCHSSYEKHELNKLGFNNAIEIGFPRYNLGINKKINTLNAQFDIKLNDKVLFWLPSRLDKAKNKNSNIYLWLNLLKNFTKKYKFICRPHPDLVTSSLIKDLKKNNFHVDLNQERKLSEIYEVSDLIFCDYGETIFSSLYFKKNLILLNYLSEFNDRFSDPIYLDVKIRNYCPNFNIDDDNIETKIEKLINNNKEWELIEDKRASFFRKIFPTEEQKFYNHIFQSTVSNYLQND